MSEQPGATTFAELVAHGALEIGDGYRAKLEELGGDGPIFLRAGLLSEQGIDWEAAERFSAGSVPKLQSKLGMAGDTMVTTKGNSVGRTGYVPAGAPAFAYSPHLSYWRSLDSRRLSPRFLYYWSRSQEFAVQLQAMAHGTDMAPYLSLSDQRRLKIRLPYVEVQDSVAQLLGSLDDKIAVNDQIMDQTRQLAQTRHQAAIQSGQWVERKLSLIAGFLGRGVTPRYTDDPDELEVLNQKCIRDGRVSFRPSRRTRKDVVPAEKLLRPNDILVNSTGVGTLGRVARWLGDSPATVDSHVTIVRIDPSRADPVCVGLAMLAAQEHIESLGEGSTGQTELSRARLGALTLTILDGNTARQIRPVLDALEARGKAALDESITLAKLRDILLPKLISGEIRVRDAERIVEDAS